MPARNVYLSDDEYAQVVYLAMKKNMKISDLLHEIIRVFLEKEKTAETSTA